MGFGSVNIQVVIYSISGSQLSAEPTFHWVFYVPDAEKSPMKIYSKSLRDNTDAVLSPRWNGGGLQIVNQDSNASSCAGLVLSQLRKTFGIDRGEVFNPEHIHLHGTCTVALFARFLIAE